MSEVFGTQYARHYDVLYQDKNYDAEVDLLAQIFDLNDLPPVHRVLDLGCGTGQHAIRLARRGYAVTGVDRSGEMLAIARANAASSIGDAASRPAFVEGDLTSVRLDEPPFDAVLMMFAVLSYQVSSESVREALDTVRAHLRVRGLFVCDVWFGPAVVAQRPSARTKIIEMPDGQVVRKVHSSLDIGAQRADVHYHMQRLRGTDVVAETSETHSMRFFFAEELATLFEASRLKLLQLRGFGGDGSTTRASPETWNVIAVGKAE
jgi:SAM-dependent methyltransferase